jgi:hypothetical protein
MTAGGGRIPGSRSWIACLRRAPGPGGAGRARRRAGSTRGQRAQGQRAPGQRAQGQRAQGQRARAACAGRMPRQRAPGACAGAPGARARQLPASGAAVRYVRQGRGVPRACAGRPAGAVSGRREPRERRGRVRRPPGSRQVLWACCGRPRRDLAAAGKRSGGTARAMPSRGCAAGWRWRWRRPARRG